MESFLVRIVDAVFRVGEAFSKRAVAIDQQLREVQEEHEAQVELERAAMLAKALGCPPHHGQRRGDRAADRIP
jgi:hypothetical protein